MGEHIDTKTTKKQKPAFSEGRDIKLERARRVTFKGYVQHLEEELLEQEGEDAFIVESQNADGSWHFYDSHDTEDAADFDCYNLNDHGDGAIYRVSKA
jgi:hypothetical protein